MDFNFLDYFYTDKFDNKTIVKNSLNKYTVADIKILVSKEIQYLTTVNIKNITIAAEDAFDFIIIFLAAVFAEKHIWIVNNNNQQKMIDNSICIDKLNDNYEAFYDFPVVRPDDITITFFTSGTTSVPKLVDKTLQCLLNESRDLLKVFDLEDKSYEFITTAPINHLYAMTFYLFLSLNSKNVINTDKINYPENLTIENSVLVTSPAFLSYMQKHLIFPEVNPKYIISAGSVLKQDTHEYFEEKSKVINIYGSTEAGITAYKEASKNDFKLFGGIKILSSDSLGTTLLSDYAYPMKTVLNDNIIACSDNYIKFGGRSDRILKIQEKRVSAEELEEELYKSGYVKTSYLFEFEGKIAALAVPSDKGSNIILEKGIPYFTKLLKSNLSEKFKIIPQKWKFTDEIPLNNMGKTDREKIKNLFSINLSLPYVVKRQYNEDMAEIELFFYKNCNFFKGHFDKFPILAGVIQLFFASFFTSEIFNMDCHIGQIKRIKFSNIIPSNSVVKLKITKTEKFVNFEYLSTDENTSYSNGSLPIENIFQGVTNE